MGALRARFAAIAVLVASTGVVGCADGDPEGAAPEPRVELIDDAIDAIVEDRGGEVELVEVSATLEDVRVLVREVGLTAVAYRYDGALAGPAEPRDDDRETFTVEQIDIDADRVFDGLRSQLGDPTIVDLAIRVDGGLVVDATVAGDGGGVMLVLLDGKGAVLGTQAG